MKSRQTVVSIFIILLLPLNILLAAEVCDHGVNFDNGATYKNLSARVTCRDKVSGRPTREVTLKDGKKNGTCLTYGYNSDKVWREENFVNDIKDGEERTWNTKENYMESTAVYKNGKRVGVGKTFHRNGKIKSISWAGADRNRDTIVQYLEDGRLSVIQCGEHSVSEEEANLCGRNGRLSDLTLYSQQGRKKETRHYLNAKASGTWTRYHNNGQASLNANYRDNVLDGKSMSYSDRGRLEKVEEFKNGFKVSKVEYYQNGNQKLKETYRREEKLIDAVQYYDNGNKHFEGTFTPKRDEWWYFTWDYWRPIGTVKTYYEDGSLETESVYKDGTLIKKKHYSGDGTLKKEEEYYPDGSRKMR